MKRVALSSVKVGDYIQLGLHPRIGVWRVIRKKGDGDVTIESVAPVNGKRGRAAVSLKFVNILDEVEVLALKLLRGNEEEVL